MASELSNVFGRVRSGDFDYQHFRAMSRLVINQAPDVQIWRAVLELIISISRQSPPASIPPSFDGTPVIYSSASMQGDEQTERLLKISLLDEIKNYTYWNVEGLFAKYFEGREWSNRSKEIYEAVTAVGPI